MKTVLSLDISSATIGWAVFQYDSNQFILKKTGFIKPIKKEKASLSARLDHTSSQIKELLQQVNPDEIAVEDYAKRFSTNKSSANTIIVLSTFNEVVSLVCYQVIKKDVFRYPVATIRAQVGKLFKVKIISKNEIIPEIINRSKIFIPELNKKSKIKKEMKDVADAIAVGIAHIFKNNSIVTFNI